MFAQVSCLVCGKLFQIDREKLGRSVACPWCGKDTDAMLADVEVQPLPVGASPPPLRRPRWLLVIAYALALVLVAGTVFVGLRIITRTSFTEFVAPDGSCKAVLPGSPREVPIGTTDELFRSGKRFVASPGWSGSKIGGELGWLDLPAEDARLIRHEDLFRTVRDRRAEELGAEPEGEGVVRVDSFQGVEVRFVKVNVRYVERYLFDPKQPRPRVYWVSVGGPGFDPESAAARKVVGSFRIEPAQ